MNNKTKKLFTDTSAFALSRFASRAITFLLLPLYTSVLSTSEYGISDNVITTINLLTPVLTLCISESVLRMTFEAKYKKNELYWNATSFIFLGTALLCCCAWVAMNSPISFSVYWWDFVLIYLLYNLDQNISYFLRALNKVKVIALVGVIQTITIVSCNVLFLIVFELGLSGYFLATIIGYLIAIILNFTLGKLYKYIFPIRLNNSLIKSMFIYSAPLVITNIAWWINTSADKYMVEYFLGVDQRGLYAVAYKIPLILTTLTTIFTDSWRLTAYEDNSADFPRFFSSVLNKLFGVCAICCCLLITFSELLAKLLFAKDFFVSWTCVPFLLMAFVFSTLSGFLASIFTKKKLTGRMSISTVCGCLINIVLNIFMIPKFGINAAGFTTFVAFFVTFIIRYIQSKQIIEIFIKSKHLIIETVTLFNMAFVMMINYSMRYVVCAIGMCIIFLCEKNNLDDILSILKMTIRKIKTR